MLQRKVQIPRLAALARDDTGLAALARDDTGLAALARDDNGLAALARDDNGLAALARDDNGLAALARDDNGLAALARDDNGLAALALVRPLVVAQTEKGGMPEQAVGSHLAVQHLAHVARLDPRGRRRLGDARSEERRVG